MRECQTATTRSRRWLLFLRTLRQAAAFATASPSLAQTAPASLDPKFRLSLYAPASGLPDLFEKLLCTSRDGTRVCGSLASRQVPANTDGDTPGFDPVRHVIQAYTTRRHQLRVRQRTPNGLHKSRP